MYDAYQIYYKRYYDSSSSDSDAGRGKKTSDEPPPEDPTMFPVCVEVTPAVVTMNRSFEFGPYRDGLEMFRASTIDFHRPERHAPLISTFCDTNRYIAGVGTTWDREAYLEVSNFYNGGTGPNELGEGIPLQIPYYVPNPKCTHKCRPKLQISCYCSHITNQGMVFNNTFYDYQLQIVIRCRRKNDDYLPETFTAWTSPNFTTTSELHFEPLIDLPLPDHMNLDYWPGTYAPYKFDLSFRWITLRKTGELYAESNYPSPVKQTVVRSSYYSDNILIDNSIGFTWLITGVTTSMQEGHDWEIKTHRSYPSMGFEVLSNDMSTTIPENALVGHGKAHTFPRQGLVRADGSTIPNYELGLMSTRYSQQLPDGTITEGHWYCGNYWDIFPLHASKDVGLIIHQNCQVHRDSDLCVGIRFTQGKQAAYAGEFKTFAQVKAEKPLLFFQSGSPNNEAASWLNSHSVTRDYPTITLGETYIHIPTTSSYIVHLKEGVASHDHL